MLDVLAWRPGGPPPKAPFGDEALVFHGFHESLLASVTGTAGDSLAVLGLAARAAFNNGLEDSARSLYRAWAERACAKGKEPWIYALIDGLVQLGLREEAARCLDIQALTAWKCPALFVLEGPEAAARCTAGRRWFTSVDEEIPFVLALFRAGQRDAAFQTLEHLVDLDGLPLELGWFLSSQDLEVCQESLHAGRAYAQLGELRRAHLVARRCAYDWVRAAIFVEITARADDIPSWTRERLPKWQHSSDPPPRAGQAGNLRYWFGP
jgi:hypothetical protein